MTFVREPAVAGRFYPGKTEELQLEIGRYVATEAEKLIAYGCVVPHAGYVYSGHVAGTVYARLELPRRFIILCPNHTGVGAPLSIMSNARWRTPLGECEVDTELASALMEAFPDLQEDTLSQRSEHGVEVQLPFLQKLAPGFKFVPITIGTRWYATLTGLGEAMATVLRGMDEKVLMMASSDMNHYEPDAVTRAKDQQAIERILGFDSEGLYELVQDGYSMCGYGPTVAMLTASKALGASSAQLLKYATSGDILGEREQVVGYAGIVVI